MFSGIEFSTWYGLKRLFLIIFLELSIVGESLVSVLRLFHSIQAVKKRRSLASCCMWYNKVDHRATIIAGIPNRVF